MFIAGAVVRVVVGLDRQTPLYYPDEYIYTALARSIADTGLPSLRGGSSYFLSILGPYLMAPAWLIRNVSDAYHVTVALGSIALSAAVFPSYVLARRVGTSRGVALAVALLAILVPDAAFTTSAMTEGYAYLLFLASVVVVVDAIATPTRIRQAAAVSVMGVLCLLRVQFVALPVAYLLAVIVIDRGSRRLRDSYLVIGATLAVVVIGTIAGVRFYGHLWNHWSALSSLALWAAIDIFVLAVAAGWVIVPAAVVGFANLLKSSDRVQRAFALLSIFTTVAIVLEAAYFDAIQQRVHERYTFYAVPLLAIAAIPALASAFRQTWYVRVAFALAILALLIPALASFRGADPSQSPTVLALQKIGTGRYQLLWALGLAALALGVARLRPRPAATVTVAAVIAGALCYVGTRVLLSYAPIAHPGGTRNVALYRLDAPPHAALVTAPNTDSYVLMKTLFWTRNVDRVLVIGGGKAADGYASQAVSFGNAGLVDHSGRPVRGPFAFPLDTTVIPDGTTSTWTKRSPPILILGLNRANGYLASVAQVLTNRSTSSRTLHLELSSRFGAKQLTFACGDRRFRALIGRSTVPIDLILPSGLSTRCRISLTKGEAIDSDGSIVSGVQVKHLALVDSKQAS